MILYKEYSPVQWCLLKSTPIPYIFLYFSAVRMVAALGDYKFQQAMIHLDLKGLEASFSAIGLELCVLVIKFQASADVFLALSQPHLLGCGSQHFPLW